MLVAVASYAVAAGQDASDKDQGHGVDKSGEKDPQVQRADAQHELEATLREVRSQLSRQFSPSDVAQVFATWPLSDATAELVAEAEQVAKALPQRMATWKPLHKPLSPIDPVLASSTIATEAAALKAANRAAATTHGTSSASLAERNASAHRAHDARKGYLHLAEGVLELVGLRAHADGLVEHHHIGRPHQAAASGAKPADKKKPGQ